LLYSAFGSFQCKECGPIAKREFAADVQRQMTVGSVGLVVVALVLFIAVIALLILLR